MEYFTPRVQLTEEPLKIHGWRMRFPFERVLISPFLGDSVFLGGGFKYFSFSPLFGEDSFPF